MWSLHLKSKKGGCYENRLDSETHIEKILLAVASFVSMLIVAFGGTDNEATQVAAIIMAGATVIGYILGEGLTDATININTEKDDADE